MEKHFFVFNNKNITTSLIVNTLWNKTIFSIERDERWTLLCDYSVVKVEKRREIFVKKTKKNPVR